MGGLFTLEINLLFYIISLLAFEKKEIWCSLIEVSEEREEDMFNV